MLLIFFMQASIAQCQSYQYLHWNVSDTHPFYHFCAECLLFLVALQHTMWWSDFIQQSTSHSIISILCTFGASPYAFSSAWSFSHFHVICGNIQSQTIVPCLATSPCTKANMNEALHPLAVEYPEMPIKQQTALTKPGTANTFDSYAF